MSESETPCRTIEINGHTYDLRATKPSGRRAVVVVDRGWIFAGDVTETGGRIYLSRCVWVFNWREIGFDGVLANPKDPKAKVKPHPDVDIPADAEVFRVPVADGWGL